VPGCELVVLWWRWRCPVSTNRAPDEPRHICLDLSAAAIRDHFAFVGESDTVAALQDADLVAAVVGWLEEGGAEPWAAYDRFCREIRARARQWVAAQQRTACGSMHQQPARADWVAVGECS